MKVLDILFLALTTAKEEEGRTRNPRLTRQIGQLIVQHYKTKENKKKVHDIISKKAKAPKTATLTNTKVWHPPVKGQDQAPTDVKVVQEKVTEASYKTYIHMTHTELMTHFGSLKIAKGFSKQLGLGVDLRKSGESFTFLFQNALRKVEGMDELTLEQFEAKEKGEVLEDAPSKVEALPSKDATTKEEEKTTEAPTDVKDDEAKTTPIDELISKEEEKTTEK